MEPLRGRAPSVAPSPGRARKEVGDVEAPRARPPPPPADAPDQEPPLQLLHLARQPWAAQARGLLQGRAADGPLLPDGAKGCQQVAAEVALPVVVFQVGLIGGAAAGGDEEGAHLQGDEAGPPREGPPVEGAPLGRKLVAPAPYARGALVPLDERLPPPPRT